MAVARGVYPNHIARESADIKRLAKFYQEILGFEEIESPKYDFEVIWLRISPYFSLHLIERNPHNMLPEGPWSATAAVADPKNLPRGHHICFSVSNFDSFVQILKEKGIETFEKTQPDGKTKQVFFFDPDDVIFSNSILEDQTFKTIDEMASNLCLSFPGPYKNRYLKSYRPSGISTSLLQSKTITISLSTQSKLNLNHGGTGRQRRAFRSTVNDSQNGDETETPTTESPSNEQSSVGKDASEGGGSESSDLGKEMKKALEFRKERGGGGGEFWSGVAEEIGEIEWPDFGNVLRTTGVVLGVIAGSSVVLLSVNAVLAELSDRIFAGKGLQDFFG